MYNARVKDRDIYLVQNRGEGKTELPEGERYFLAYDADGKLRGHGKLQDFRYPYSATAPDVERAIRAKIKGVSEANGPGQEEFQGD